MDSPKISVIIPAKNEAAKIERCLKSVFAQSYPPGEVFVVDAYSMDKTVEIAQKYPVKILYNKHIIRAGACHEGLKHASGDYIAFVDADCIADKDWLGNFVRELQDGIIGLAGATMYETGQTTVARSISLSLRSFVGSGDSVQWRFYPTKRIIKSPSGCNCIYSKKALLEVGGFDVNVSGGEDEDVNRRLRKKGKFLYVPDAVVWHYHNMTTLKQYIKKMWQYGKWKTEARAWTLRAISPPLIVPPLLLSLFFTQWVLIVAIMLYSLIVVLLGLKTAVRQKSAVYAISVPFICALGHTCYTIGFWQELILPRAKVNIVRKRFGSLFNKRNGKQAQGSEVPPRNG